MQPIVAGQQISSTAHRAHRTPRTRRSRRTWPTAAPSMQRRGSPPHMLAATPAASTATSPRVPLSPTAASSSTPRAPTAASGSQQTPTRGSVAATSLGASSPSVKPRHPAHGPGHYVGAPARGCHRGSRIVGREPEGRFPHPRSRPMPHAVTSNTLVANMASCPAGLAPFVGAREGSRCPPEAAPPASRLADHASRRHERGEPPR